MSTVALSGPGVTERIEAQVAALLADVNTASSAARNGWMFFLALMAYFFVTLSGVTHTDLLLNRPISLPILQIEIPLSSFFLFAPAVLVLVHFGLLMQHVMLSRKVLEFHERLTAFEGPQLFRSHRLRVQLHSYFFAQATGGPKRGVLFAAFLYLMSWVSLGLLPVLLFLYFQTSYLPYHDWVVTAAHRAYLVMDFSVLLIFGVFVRFPNQGFFAGLRQSFLRHSSNFSLMLAVSLGVLFFSFCVATLPDSRLDRAMTRLMPAPVPYGETNRAQGRYAFLPTAYFFENASSAASFEKSGLFSRNLLVADADLVADQQWEPRETSIVLRGRDLRYASLVRTDLHRADLSYAVLDQADLTGTNLSGAKMRNARFAGVQLTRAKLTEADLDNSVLNGAQIYGADLRGANLSRASLIGAVLSEAKLQGAILKLGDLKGADLRMANLRGANMEFARLTGSDLTGALVSGADFSHADVQAALLPENMEGAVVSALNVWQTAAPRQAGWRSAYFTRGPVFAPVSKEELSRLQLMIRSPLTHNLSRATYERLKSRLQPMFNDAEVKAWKLSLDYKNWLQLGKTYNGGPAERAKLLAHTVCSDGSDKAYVLRALVRRLRPDVDSRFETASARGDVLGQSFGNIGEFLGEIDRCNALERVPVNYRAALKQAARLNQAMINSQSRQRAPVARSDTNRSSTEAFNTDTPHAAQN